MVSPATVEDSTEVTCKFLTQSVHPKACMISWPGLGTTRATGTKTSGLSLTMHSGLICLCSWATSTSMKSAQMPSLGSATPWNASDTIYPVSTATLWTICSGGMQFNNIRVTMLSRMQKISKHWSKGEEDKCQWNSSCQNVSFRFLINVSKRWCSIFYLMNWNVLLQQVSKLKSIRQLM